MKRVSHISLTDLKNPIAVNNVKDVSKLFSSYVYWRIHIDRLNPHGKLPQWGLSVGILHCF